MFIIMFLICYLIGYLFSKVSAECNRRLSVQTCYRGISSPAGAHNNGMLQKFINRSLCTVTVFATAVGYKVCFSYSYTST